MTHPRSRQTAHKPESILADKFFKSSKSLLNLTVCSRGREKIGVEVKERGGLHSFIRYGQA
jgi:hypothetical protein